jgi:transcriptional regulator with XRE-family HTH domain
MQTKRQDFILFAERLRVERTRLRMTQWDMAQLGGVSKTSQVAYESGSSYPDANYLAKLAEGGFDVQWLLIGRRTPEHNWDLEAEIFDLIEEWSASRNRPLANKEKFALLENLYRQFSADQRIDHKAVVRTLKLVSGIG